MSVYCMSVGLYVLCECVITGFNLQQRLLVVYMYIAIFFRLLEHFATTVVPCLVVKPYCSF